MIEWNYKLEKELHHCLKQAFTAKGMARLLRFELAGRSWKSIVSANDNFDDQLFDLILAAKREGWLTELALAAGRTNSTNQQLAKLIGKIKSRQTQSTITQIPKTEKQLSRHALAAPSGTPLIPHIVTDSILNIEWCWVPAGEFMMGEGDKMHKVQVEGFWMMRHPVTNGQYARFVDDGGYQTSTWWTQNGWTECYRKGWDAPRLWTDKKWNGVRQPVVEVSLFEARAFIRWAAVQIGCEIQLPTEVQWEKAARGIHAYVYPWGNHEPTDKLLNYNSNVGRTTEVGQYSPAGDSPYGCTDMAGNVIEWCEYSVRDEDSRFIRSTSVVLRGGAWNANNDQIRTTFRGRRNPYGWSIPSGFRCVSIAF